MIAIGQSETDHEPKVHDRYLFGKWLTDNELGSAFLVSHFGHSASLIRARTNMLSWGFATEGVCVCAGSLMLRQQMTNRVKGAEKTKRFQKGPLSCRRENQL